MTFVSAAPWHGVRPGGSGPASSSSSAVPPGPGDVDLAFSVDVAPLPAAAKYTPETRAAGIEAASAKLKHEFSKAFGGFVGSSGG